MCRYDLFSNHMNHLNIFSSKVDERMRCHCGYKFSKCACGSDWDWDNLVDDVLVSLYGLDKCREVLVQKVILVCLFFSLSGFI